MICDTPYLLKLRDELTDRYKGLLSVLTLGKLQNGDLLDKSHIDPQEIRIAIGDVRVILTELERLIKE